MIIYIFNHWNMDRFFQRTAEISLWKIQVFSQVHACMFFRIRIILILKTTLFDHAQFAHITYIALIIHIIHILHILHIIYTLYTLCTICTIITYSTIYTHFSDKWIEIFFLKKSSKLLTNKKIICYHVVTQKEKEKKTWKKYWL